MNAREGEYTSSVERLRAEYLAMRASGFGFTGLYAAEWDRILAAHDEAIRADQAERIAVALEDAAPKNPDGSPYGGMVIAAKIARTTDTKAANQ